MPEASEAEAGQSARLCRPDHGRSAWLDAVHVPRRWSLRWRVERGSDARSALIGFGGPAVVRPCPRDPRDRVRVGYPRRVTLEHDVRVANRHRGRTPRIARDVAPLARTRARLEPERAVHPEGTDRGYMRAAVLVDGGQPRRAGVRRVRSRCRPRVELLGDGGPIHRRQPIRLTQIYDLHIPNLPARFSRPPRRCRPANWQRADDPRSSRSSAGPVRLWRARRAAAGWYRLVHQASMITSWARPVSMV